MGKYRSFGIAMNRQFRNDLNANFEDVSKDVLTQKDRVDTLIRENPQPSEVVDARGGFPVVRDRLDNVDAQLAQKEQEIKIVEDNSAGNAIDLWIPPTQPTMDSIVGEDYLTAKINKFYSLFDGLANDFPSNVSKTVVGVTGTGYDFNEYVFQFTDKPSKTEIIGAGIHGSEKIGILALYRFLYHLCHDYKTSTHLKYIRENVRLVVMPLENPYGVDNHYRKNHRGVDLNRNFNYKWNEFTVTDPSSNFYKGTSAESEEETQFIKTVLEKYSEAIAYIDIHDKGTDVNTTFTSSIYAPRYEDSETNLIKELQEAFKPKIASSYTSYEFDCTSFPSGFNFAAATYGMHSYNPEWIAGYWGDRGSSTDFTKAVQWFGNIILRIATLNSKATHQPRYEPRADLKSFFYTAASAITVPLSITTLSEIPTFSGTLAIRTDGYAKVTYTLTYFGTDDTSQQFFCPVLYQTNSTSEFKKIGVDGVTDYTYRKYFEVYDEGMKRRIVTVTALIPINQFEGHINFSLWARNTAGTCKISRVTRLVEIIPSLNKKEMNVQVTS